MDNSIFEMFSKMLMGGFNSNPSNSMQQNNSNTQNNNAYSYYPNEVFSNENNNNTQNNVNSQSFSNNTFEQPTNQTNSNPFNQNNIMPMLLSMLSGNKNTSFPDIMSALSGQTKKEDGQEKNDNLEMQEKTPPNDNIIL